MADYALSILPSMISIPREEWDGLASRHGSPLLSWGFLALLEESGSIVPERGWTPLHFTLRREGRLVAAAPFYAKTSSWGEFVFDYQFARAAESAGVTYYPKLLGMIPATPSPAWRVLVAEGEDEESLAGLILDAAVDAAREAGFGGVHLAWPSVGTQAFLRGRASGQAREKGAGEADGEPGNALGDTVSPRRDFVAWDHQSFLWEDAGYGDFEGLLASFSKNMRRNVLRERKGLDEAGIVRRIIEAPEASRTPGLLSRMADFYELTNDKFGPWGAKWLERDFFLRLPEFLPEGWALGAAFSDEASSRAARDPLALSFLFVGEDTLWGRYWGAERRVEGLHFELCYYLPLEWALSRGLACFDPGMGSEHKARRGFRSVLAPSFHLVFHEGLAGAIRRSLVSANAAEAEGARLLDEELPYRKDGTPGLRRDEGR